MTKYRVLEYPSGWTMFGHFELQYFVPPRAGSLFRRKRWGEWITAGWTSRREVAIAFATGERAANAEPTIIFETER